MSAFEKYLRKLAEHEKRKSSSLLDDPRVAIMVYGGMRLNWLGDYFGNPKIMWEEHTLPVEKIHFGGASPEWNKVLIDRCERSPFKFHQLVMQDEQIRQKFEQEASYGEEVILVRHSPHHKDHFQVLDGMHRFVGAVLRSKEEVQAWVPVNEHEYLPHCEPHTIYDLIRGFIRHAKDKQGKEQLYHALLLLTRVYENVTELLRTRFNKEYVHDDDVQDVIQRVLEKQ